MSDKSEEWYTRATETIHPRDRLKLVEEVLASDEAPEFLKNTACRSMQSLKTYIDGGMVNDTDRHRAAHHFQSLKLALGDVK